MNKLRKWYVGQNVAFQLIPFLFLYLFISVFLAPKEFVGDETRYLSFATNLSNGFYSPPFPNISLWSGPGYPLILVPFVLFKFPILAMRLLNGVLLYVSLIISSKTIGFYSSKKTSLLFTILLGMYFPIFEMLPLLYTETLAWFLISLTSYLFIKINTEEKINWKLIFFTSVTIAFLSITKVIFGYVIVLMVFISLLFSLFKRFRQIAFRSAIIFIFSFILCMPWLFYTYGMANKVFYWANSGGMSLYTMSSPFEEELGDWKNSEQLLANPNHHVFMDSIMKLDPIEKDEAFKNEAFQNIKKYPKKYFFNWLANVGRLFFSYPYSNHNQSITTYWTLIPNMVLVVIIVQILLISFINKTKFPQELIVLAVFFLVYLFGSTFISAYRRMFYITVPFWIIFISYAYSFVLFFKRKQ